MNCTIYKICSPSGECLYVGSTTGPRSRAAAHRVRFPNGVFSIIEEVSISKRARSEKAAIMRFRGIGQASLNKTLPSENGREKLRKKLLALTAGKKFHIATDTDRIQVLQVAKILDLPIRTRRTKTGFEVIRVLP